MALARSAAREQAFDTDIFIQIRPVNSLAPRDQSPVVPLGGFAMRKARKPRERSRDGPSVRQVYGERIIAYTDALRQCFFEFSPRSTHSMISIDRRRFPRPAFLTLNLGSSEAATPLEPDGVQPEFRACLVALNVHMGWLVSIRRVKEKAVWSLAKNRRQRSQFTRSARAVGPPDVSGRCAQIGRHTPLRDVQAAPPKPMTCLRPNSGDCSP